MKAPTPINSKMVIRTEAVRLSNKSIMYWMQARPSGTRLQDDLLGHKALTLGLLLYAVRNWHGLRDRQLDFHGRARLRIVNPEFAAQPMHAVAHSADAHAYLFESEFS